MRTVLLILGVGILAGLGSRMSENTLASASSVELGKAVYVKEGCVHCHSQYVRPLSLDTKRYGPVSDLPDGGGEAVLIGNRRQGPDLSNVALRRPRTWNRVHLIDPLSISPNSRMPSYAHLFDGDAKEGEVLLDYLDSLGSGSEL